MLLSQEKLDELESVHKKVFHLEIDGQTIVLRKPTRGEWKKFRSDSTNDAKKSDANEMLWRALVVFPSREEFSEMLEEYPALCESPECTTGLKWLCGMVAEGTSK
jgi:hypothetical protein